MFIWRFECYLCEQLPTHKKRAEREIVERTYLWQSWPASKQGFHGGEWACASFAQWCVQWWHPWPLMPWMTLSLLLCLPNMSAILPIILYIMGTIYNFFPYTKRSCLHNWSFDQWWKVQPVPYVLVKCLYVACFSDHGINDQQASPLSVLILNKDHGPTAFPWCPTTSPNCQNICWTCLVMLCLKSVGVPHGFSQFVAQAPQCLPPRISSARYSPLCSCSAVSSGNVYL